MGLRLVALHGFLGAPSDWEPVLSAAKIPLSEALLPDLAMDPVLGPHVPIHEWGKNFRTWIEKNISSDDKVLLLGYSQGGRLALHAAEALEDRLAHAMIVSANPGFTGLQKAEKENRMKQDEAWAARFASENWDEVLRAWNAQDVFRGGKSEPIRSEQRISAACLRQWTLAKQKDFRLWIRDHSFQITWIVGERDAKFVALAESLKDISGDLTVVRVAQSGHRVLFDRPDALGTLLRLQLAK